METVVNTYGINTFKHFMAYKGALMVNDDELYNSFSRCAALVRCLWCMRRTATSSSVCRNS